MAARSRRTALDDARDVLAARSPPRFEDLFDLIHAVNPTGKDLGERQRTAAYALKAQLQSLLIERFGELLVVEELEGAQGEVVGLRHRTYQKDACHAVLSELSVAARAWVQLQRDLRSDREGDADLDAARASATTAPAQSPRHGAGKMDTGPWALIEQGEAALGEYDFERARERFAAALEWPVTWEDGPSHVRAAHALLELLVDRLADDGAALALRERLPAPVAQDHRVRCLLALAAARQGERALAQKLIVGVDSEPERVHEVLVELARGALAAGEVSECEQHLSHVPAASAQAAAAKIVADAARQLRAERAQPLEQRLSVELERGDLEVARELAEELMALHPGSEVAHRALAAVREARHASTAQALAAQLERALEALDVDTASALRLRLEALGGPRPDLEARVADATRTRAAVRERAAIDELAVALAGELSPRVVEAYWGASEGVREQARLLVERPELDWLDELGPVKGNAACAAAAAAARALPQVERELETGAVESAEQTAAAHEALACTSGRGRHLLERVRAAASVRRRGLALARLDAADAAVAASAAHASFAARLRPLQELAAIPRADLDEEGRQRLDALTERLGRAERTERLRRRRLRVALVAGAATLSAGGIVAGLLLLIPSAPPPRLPSDRDFEAAMQRGDLLEARTAAARAAKAATDAKQRAAWLERHDQINRQIRSRYIEDEASGAAVAETIGDLWPRTTGTPPACVTADGDVIAFAEQRGRWILVRSLHRDPSRSRAAVLRLRQGFELTGMHVEDRKLAVLGSQMLFSMSVDTLDIDNALTFSALVPEGRTTLAAFVPGRRYLWVDWIADLARVALQTQGGTKVTGGTSVISRDDSSTARQIGNYRVAVPLWGLEKPAMVLSRTLADFALVDDSGQLLWDDRGDYVFHTAVSHPDGRSVVVLSSRGQLLSEGSGMMLRAQCWSIDGRRGQEVKLGWMPRGRFGQAATALAEGITYVLAEVGIDTEMLIALRAQGADLVELWRRQVGPHVTLVQDAEGQHVTAFCNDGERGRFTTLSSKPPADLLWSGARPQRPPPLDPYQSCRWMSEGLVDRIEAYQAVLALLPEQVAIERVRALHDGPLDVISGAALCFRVTGQLRADLLQRLEELHADAGEVRLLLAEQRLHEGSPGDALATLEHLEQRAQDAERPLAPSMARHAAHLRALCRLRLGDAVAARDELERAPAPMADGCPLEPLSQWLRDLIAPLDDLLGELGSTKQRGPSTRVLVARLRAADRELERGNAEAARAWLDHPTVWAFPDAQALGRMAEAYLRLAPDNDAALRVRKRWVLACFTDRMVKPRAVERISLGSATWPLPRLEEVAERARQWLGDPPPTAAPRGEARATDAAAGAAAPTRQFLETGPPPRHSTAVMLADEDAERTLRRHESDLVAEGRAMGASRSQRVVGLVLDPALAAAEHYETAREQLRGTRGPGPEPALVVPAAQAFRLLADWPQLFDQFEAFDVESVKRGELSLLLLRAGGAAWRRARL